jgi:CheY-like chemotaxis protein
LKILVIDDNPVHRQSAHQTLEGHDLTVVGSYDEALKLMGCYFPGFQNNRQMFDAVLTDLMMPAGMGGSGGDGAQYIGQEMPIGLPLVLIAVLHSGAKYLAVVTDTNRHAHPVSWAIDMLIGRDDDGFRGELARPKFTMNNAVVGFYNSGHSALRVLIAGSDQQGKHWGAVLANLIA